MLKKTLQIFALTFGMSHAGTVLASACACADCSCEHCDCNDCDCPDCP